MKYGSCIYDARSVISAMLISAAHSNVMQVHADREDELKIKETRSPDLENKWEKQNNDRKQRVKGIASVWIGGAFLTCGKSVYPVYL
ncbi:hypothetical protein AALH30_21885 [Blautia pseudococcoides]|uniref:hypothetical protein n=1 Tax=Blautia pseudococcoides TaxID=1796616 RepID=UPI00148AEA92|nr:hypothetical protein [Blautia pseudococcoides]QJU16465.1 hypothetical protein HL650_19765 [Blautia pseudococcoides]